jgi:predicted O-methyltransferase YrrM
VTTTDDGPLDFQDAAYADLKKDVDRLIASTTSASDYEAGKGAILRGSTPYVRFLSASALAGGDAVRGAIDELSGDRDFFDLIDDGLQALAGYARQGVRTGELRIHAHTVYVLVRLLRPATVVETGIANGKSSALILRALERNGAGRLVSVDLPTRQEAARDHDDGLLPAGRAPGWLVPERLRTRWDVNLGDARDLLPRLKRDLGPIDLFFHDSLHTFDHMMFELTLAKSWVKPGGAVACDDIQDNEAFATASLGLPRAAFGTFGVFHSAVA